MISSSRCSFVWAVWALLFGALYVRAFWGGGASEPLVEASALVPPIEEVTLDPLPPPPTPEPEQPQSEPEQAEPAPLDLPTARHPDPAPPIEATPPTPVANATPKEGEEGHDRAESTSALPESMQEPPAQEPPPEPMALADTVAPHEASEGHEPYVETYLMLPGLPGLAALERDFGLVVLAFDGEACFRARADGGAPRFEPIALNELLRTHHGQRYLVPSLDLAGRPTPYRVLVEAFARFRRASGERLQVQVALPAERSRAIEEARLQAQNDLRARQRWWGVLLVHFEGHELRFEVQ